MVVSKMVPKNSDDVDIGCGNAFGGEADAEAEVKHIGLQEDEMQPIVRKYSAKMLTIWKPNRFDLDVIRLSSRSDETSASSLEAPSPPPSLPLTTSAR